MKKTEDVNTPMIALVGILGAILLFVLTVGVLAWIRGAQDREIRRKIIDPPDQQLTQHTAKQMEAITSYRMVDPNKNIVSIPIDRAMSLVVKDITTSATRTQGGGKNDEKKNE